MKSGTVVPTIFSARINRSLLSDRQGIFLCQRGVSFLRNTCYNESINGERWVYCRLEHAQSRIHSRRRQLQRARREARCIGEYTEKKGG